MFIVKNHLLVESIFFVSLLQLHLSQKRSRYDNRRNIEGYSGNAGYIRSCNFFYRYQNHADDDETNGHVVGAGYTFKF